MTVEAALVLCSLVVVLALAVGAVAAAGAQLRCLDAAREAARLVARGEPERARQAAEDIAPGGARVDVRTVGDEVTVEVSIRGAGHLPGLTVSGRAMGVLEPGALIAGPPLGEPSGPVDEPGDPAVAATGPAGEPDYPVGTPDPAGGAPDPAGAPTGPVGGPGRSAGQP